MITTDYLLEINDPQSEQPYFREVESPDEAKKKVDQYRAPIKSREVKAFLWKKEEEL